jgi:COMPASS component SDC1
MANDSTPIGATPVAESLTNTPQAQAQAQAQASASGRPGGAPTRVYMNEKIVPYLLEGMKSVAKEQYVLSLWV